MCKSRALMVSVLLLALLAASAWAAPKPESFVEVQSPHFLVVANKANDGRRVAGQLERMRILFESAFPGLQDPAVPIEVLALRGEKDFDQVIPTSYLGKGKLLLSGYFQRGEDRDYVAMRLDLSDDANPYATIYHEYTHALVAQEPMPVPIWLNEGLAQFYENSQIAGSQATFGMADPQSLDYLRAHPKWLPLPQLFQVDANSPYYHEEAKGTLFYAESWFVTHYFMTLRNGRGRQELARYITLIGQQVDPVTAARRAFGDLDQLQKNLNLDLQHLAMYDFVTKISDHINDKSFPVQPLPPPQADAIRADFIAHVARFDQASALLHSVLSADPRNLRALETLGYIASRQGHLRQALGWYTQAVKLNSQDFLAQFLFGAMTLSNDPHLDDAAAAQVEASLRAAIKLNPRFAPAYDRLAVAEAERLENLPQARLLELQAIQLDPGQLAYRFNMANILMQMDQFDGAIQVLQNALPLATAPAQAAECRQRLRQLQTMRQAEAYPDAAAAGLLGGTVTGRYIREAVPASSSATHKPSPAAPASTAPSTASPAPTPAVPPPPPSGPRRSLLGRVRAVRCQADNAMQVDLQVGARTVTLTSPNYLGVHFTATFTPKGIFYPCRSMPGLRARVTAVGNILVAISLSKE